MNFIAQTIEEMKKGVYDFTVDRKCSNCGSCCSNFLPMSREEAKRIKRYISQNGIKEVIRRPPTVNPVFDFKCPFRDDDKKICTIYEVRPAICRDFQCDKPRKQIKADRDMYHGQYTVVDMRWTFFGGKR